MNYDPLALRNILPVVRAFGICDGQTGRIDLVAQTRGGQVIQHIAPLQDQAAMLFAVRTTASRKWVKVKFWRKKS